MKPGLTCHPHGARTPTLLSSHSSPPSGLSETFWENIRAFQSSAQQSIGHTGFCLKSVSLSQGLPSRQSKEATEYLGFSVESGHVLCSGARQRGSAMVYVLIYPVG